MFGGLPWERTRLACCLAHALFEESRRADYGHWCVPDGDDL